MDKEKRLRRLKAMIVASAQDVRQDAFVVEIPGYSLRTRQRASSQQDAVNQAVKYWVRNGDLNPSQISEPLKIKVTNKDRQTIELSVPIDQALSGSTSYRIPEFGGYSDKTPEAPLEVDEDEFYGVRPSKEELEGRQMVMDKVDSVDIIEPLFSNPTIIATDPKMQFDPEDINKLLFRAANKSWITIPNESAKRRIPNIYYLSNPTDHDKYFGAKTEYGYIPTFATAILHHLAKAGSAPRDDISKLKKLMIPDDYPMSGIRGYRWIMTLPPAIESAAIREAYNILSQAKRKPGLLRRLKYLPQGGNFEYTVGGSSIGTQYTEPTGRFTPEMEKRLVVLDRGVSRSITEYAMLNALVSDFIGELESKMDRLLKEQHAINASSKFLKPSGKREAVDDVLKQVILRKIVGAIQGVESFYDNNGVEISSPLEGTEYNEESYSLPK